MSACELVIMGAGGRMGRAVAEIAAEDARYRVAGAVARPGREDTLAGYGCVKGTDLEGVLDACPGAVVVDFTSPGTSLEVAAVAARAGNPAVIGTTGFSAGQLARLEDAAKIGRIFWSPNMSIGVNVLARALPALAMALGLDYDIEIAEIHHGRKADAPSGTAVRLGQAVAGARGLDLEAARVSGRDGIVGPRREPEIGVMALRGGDVVGDHTVYFLGPGERIEVTHRAHSRETLARGALRAAAWIAGREPGRLHTMADMLQ